MASSDTDHWKSERGYIWSMLGSAIGFANLLGFGSQCYRNGGGAFLIPFFAALFILGIPMLILEGMVGQHTQKPLVSAYGRFVGRKGKVFGWLAVIAVLTIGAFYTVLTGWAVAYVYFSITGQIAAASDMAAFFASDFLHISSSISEFGKLSIVALFSTLFVALLSWWVISKNIQSGIEKWCSFFLPLLFFMVLLFCSVVIFLPGSWIGFIEYLRPDFSKLYSFSIWRDVFGQLFFSLSLGLGIVVGYSRHNQRKMNLRKAMFQVAMADFLISFLAGFIIFGCIGYMAQQSGIDFHQIAQSSSVFDIGYVIFPMILRTFGPIFSSVIGAVFFFCLFIAGITGVFSIVESIVGNIEFEFGAGRRKAVSFAMGLITLLAIPFCMGNGTSIIDSLEPMVLGNTMLLGGIAQVVVFLYLSKEIRDHNIWFKEGKRVFAFYALKYFSLPILAISLLFSMHFEYQTGLDIPTIVRFGWFVFALLLAIFLAYRGGRPSTVQ